MDTFSSSSEDGDYILTTITELISSDETLRQNRKHRMQRQPNISRGRCSWYHDYLSDNPVYSLDQFRQRFRISMQLYRRFERELPVVEPALLQKCDATGRPGATTWQKILVSLRRLGNGASFSSLDDQSRMSETSIRTSFKLFCSAIKRRYGSIYLNRTPRVEELATLEQKYASKMFPGCVGAIDCMNLKWKNCPKAWKGQFHNPNASKLATIQVEAVSDMDLYCWHVYNGRPGTNNDLTVMESSPLLISILNQNRRMKLDYGYLVNGIRRDWYLYYLADGIYPRWPIFITPNHAPTCKKEKVMTKAQESRRKDVERLFGVLQGPFKILRNELHEWCHQDIVSIFHTCVIIHNMIFTLYKNGEITEHERDFGAVDHETIHESSTARNDASSTVQHPSDDICPSQRCDVISVEESLRCSRAHQQLKKALEDHIWTSTGTLLEP